MFEVVSIAKKSEDIFVVELERDNLSCSVDIVIDENTNSPYGDWSEKTNSSNFTDDDLCDAIGSALCYLESNYYIFCDEEFNWHYTTREM